jgi:uncharacterized protein YndB with AHSA1/START domain
MPDIIHRVGIKAPPARVYAAVATVKGVAGWWTKDTTGDDQVGGTMRFRFTAPDGSVMGDMRMVVRKLKKNRLVQWRVVAGPPEWIGTDITFDLSKEGNYTIVMFGHVNWRKRVKFMAHCSMKWAVFLLSLKSLVETGKGKPAPRDIKIDNWN